jgi:hypothetical protein
MSKSAEQAAEELQNILSGISTKDLVDELSKREGVSEWTILSSQAFNARRGVADDTSIYWSDIMRGDGPTRILVVTDDDNS